jgi:hypothetical protein
MKSFLIFDSSSHIKKLTVMTIEKSTPLFLLCLLTACLLSATIANAQSDALFVSPQGYVGIGTTTPASALEVNGDIKLGINRKIWWDWEGRDISVIGAVLKANPGITGVIIRFRNSMTAGRGNPYGGFDFTDEANNSVLRILNNRVGIGNDNPQYPLDVSGDIKATGVIRDRSGILVPQGGIIMYSGPYVFDASGRGKAGGNMEGWAVCNGQNSTPDLRDKFVVGAGGSYAVGVQGGEMTHTLTEAEMPNHSHPYGVGGGNGRGSGNTGQGTTEGYPCNNCAYGTWTGKTGGNQPHENRPPYYAVYYIMKL